MFDPTKEEIEAKVAAANPQPGTDPALPSGETQVVTDPALASQGSTGAPPGAQGEPALVIDETKTDDDKSSAAFASMRVALNEYDELFEPLDGKEAGKELITALAGENFDPEIALSNINKHLGEARYSAMANQIIERHVADYAVEVGTAVLSNPSLLAEIPEGREFLAWKQAKANGTLAAIPDDQVYSDTRLPAPATQVPADTPQWIVDELAANRRFREDQVTRERDRDQQTQNAAVQREESAFNAKLVEIANSELGSFKFSTDEAEDAKIKRGILNNSLTDLLADAKIHDADGTSWLTKAEKAIRDNDAVAVRGYRARIGARLKEIARENAAFESRRSVRTATAEENLRNTEQRTELPNSGAQAPRTAEQTTGGRAFDPATIAERARQAQANRSGSRL